MKNLKYFLWTSCVFLAGLSNLKSQEIQKEVCTYNQSESLKTEIENITGETMGQKLESLLFWTQEERERRFPEMYKLFPSLPIEKGDNVYPLAKEEQVSLKFKNGFSADSYMKDNHIAGLIVVQSDRIIFEKYAEGVSENSLWTSFSVAKSVSSILLGIALKDGDIESMDDLLEKYIPELEGYDYGKVSVYQLLTMTSGVGWNEDYADHNSDVAQMYLQTCQGNEDHILSYMKNLKFVHRPGTVWNYSTGETDLLGILIQKASGKSLAAYLSEKVWQPWGMEHCAYWLKDECSGANIGGSGLSASLRDFARLGTLMLNKGQNGELNLFTDDYLKNATRPLYKTNDSGAGYGYLWWRDKDSSYRAVGIFGQVLYINPDKDLIIAQIAAWPQATSKELTKNRQEFIDAVEHAVK